MMTGIRRSAELSDELDALAARAARFVAGFGETADDVELWLERRSRAGYRFEGRRLVPELEPGVDRVGFRVLRDGRLGAASCTRVDEAAWRACVAGAAASASADFGLPSLGTPRARRPGPMTFDPELADALGSPQALHRLADAVCDNTWHEAERTPGLTSFGGSLAYTVRRYVVATRRGVAGSLHGDLDARVRLNGCYVDVLHQVHVPESFQPLALLGARTLRMLPEERATPADLRLSGRIPVVLHPRVLEQLLRRLGTPLLTGSARRAGLPWPGEGERVASPAITLVDDSALDGLSTSRPFDDEGTPTRRNPLLLRGRLAQVLHTRVTAVVAGATPTGSGFRRPAGTEDPQDATVRAGLGSLLMERGDASFHEIVAGLDKAILVHELLGVHAADTARARFSCGVSSGVTIERGRESRLLAPGSWQVSGNLIGLPGGPRGLLDELELSRELHDTGSAILPFCLTWLDV